ncbi:hypothetical protein ABT369_52575 [Dactylosporangium sp. NPDC000244]|uniref:hypothetical protein n=1 Tax=Dactylosporangium sp. NPDC000244 TaxID=3154365 RepID=UPI003332EA20
MFALCRLMMTASTSTIVALGPATAGQPEGTLAEHIGALLPAAQAAGLQHVLHIVALASTGAGDEFLYYATDTEIDAARRSQTEDAAVPAYHAELLVFRHRCGR